MKNDKKKKNVIVLKDDSKKIIESLIFSRAKYNITIYGQRLLIRLVECVQKYINQPIDSEGSINSVEIGTWGDAVIDIPIRNLLMDDTDKNYAAVKKAIKALMDTILEYEDDRRYTVMRILTRADYDRYDRNVKIKVEKEIWECMLNFSKGYVSYNPEVALNLKSKYSLFFYKMVAGKSNPVTYKLETLREILGLETKYKETRDFVKWVIKSSKEELDEKSPWSFDYTLESDSSNVQASRICFYPVRVIKNMSRDMVRNEISPSMLLDSEVLHILKYKLYFENSEIKANFKLFECISDNMGDGEFAAWLDNLVQFATRAENIQGYVINAVKNLLFKKYGIIYE